MLPENILFLVVFDSSSFFIYSSTNHYWNRPTLPSGILIRELNNHCSNCITGPSTPLCFRVLLVLSSWLNNCIFIHAVNLPGPGNTFLLLLTFRNIVLYMVYGFTSFSILEIFSSCRDHWPDSSNCRISSQSWYLEVAPEKEGLVHLNSIFCNFWPCWLLPQTKPSSTFTHLLSLLH